MRISALIKLVLSLTMLGLVLFYVDFKTLAQTLRGVPTSTFIIVLLGYICGQIISSVKWWLLARAGGLKATYWEALKAYFLGMYVNSFSGFGTIGGDVARGLLLDPVGKQKTESVMSVFADRAHGLAVLATIGIFSLLIFDQTQIEPFYRYGLYLSVIFLIIGWIVGPSLLLKIVPKTSRFRAKAEGVVKVFPKDPLKITQITLLSILFHTVQISLHGVIAAGLGLSISTAVLFSTIPFVNILSSLPISWQGLGVRETGYFFFLGDYITSEQAVAFGAIWLAVILISSGIGGVFAVITGDLKGIRGKRNETPA